MRGAMEDGKHDAASALDYARKAHENQFDDSGENHFAHVRRVVANVREILDGLPPGTFDEVERDRILQVAALHDCPEDEEFTGVTHEALERDGFDPDVRAVVCRLDKRFKVGTYQENVVAMVDEGDIRVVIVKLGDNRDNRSPARIAQLPPEKRSILRRYERAAAVLESGVDDFARRSATTRPR